MSTKTGAFHLARLITLSCLLLLAALPCRALEPEYLREFPDPQRVIRDVRGTDRMDTLARQSGAFIRLRLIIREMAGARYNTPGQYPTADERRLLEAYGAAAAPVSGEAMSTFDPKATGMDTPRARWKGSVTRYSNSPELQAELLQRYFSPAFRQAHAAMMGDRDASAKAYRAEEQRRLRALKGEREPAKTPWTELSAGTRSGMLGFGGAMIGLLILSGLREFRRFGFDRSNPRVLRAGPRRYRVDWVTGILSDYSTRREKMSFLIDSTTGAIVLNAVTHQGPTHTRYHDYLSHEQFALVHGAGRHPVQIDYEYGNDTDSQGAFWRETGNQVTAVWVTPRMGKMTGQYILFHNWTTTRDIPHPVVTRPTVDSIVAMNRLTLYPALGLGFVIGYSTGIFGDIVPRFLRGLLLAALVAGAWLLLSKAVGALRRRRFERDELPRFSQLIDNRDAAPADPATAP